jgi:hypothetical protein
MKRLLIFTLFVSALACAADKAPLSPTLLAAKKAYLENRTHASIGDKAYSNLKKWGRFELVSDPKDGDIIFIFSADETPGKLVSTSGQGLGSVRSTYVPNTGVTSMTVVDAKTQTTLYSDVRKWTGGWSRSVETGKLIDSLKKRIEKGQ